MEADVSQSLLMPDEAAMAETTNQRSPAENLVHMQPKAAISPSSGIGAPYLHAWGGPLGAPHGRVHARSLGARERLDGRLSELFHPLQERAIDLDGKGVRQRQATVERQKDDVCERFDVDVDVATVALA